MVLLWENLQVVVNACITWLIIKTDQAVLSGYIKHGFMRAIYKILLWNHDSHEWLQMCG